MAWFINSFLPVILSVFEGGGSLRRNVFGFWYFVFFFFSLFWAILSDSIILKSVHWSLSYWFYISTFLFSHFISADLVLRKMSCFCIGKKLFRAEKYIIDRINFLLTFSIQTYIHTSRFSNKTKKSKRRKIRWIGALQSDRKSTLKTRYKVCCIIDFFFLFFLPLLLLCSFEAWRSLCSIICELSLGCSSTQVLVSFVNRHFSCTQANICWHLRKFAVCVRVNVSIRRMFQVDSWKKKKHEDIGDRFNNG